MENVTIGWTRAPTFRVHMNARRTSIGGKLRHVATLPKLVQRELSQVIAPIFALEKSYRWFINHGRQQHLCC